MTFTIDTINYLSKLEAADKNSIPKIEADFTNLSKIDLRAALKLCKEKLVQNTGIISAVGIKKNSLKIVVDDSVSIT